MRLVSFSLHFCVDHIKSNNLYVHRSQPDPARPKLWLSSSKSAMDVILPSKLIKKQIRQVYGLENPALAS